MEIVSEGSGWTVDEPEIVPLESCDISSMDKRLHCLLAFRSALRLHKVGPET